MKSFSVSKMEMVFSNILLNSFKEFIDSECTYCWLCFKLSLRITVFDITKKIVNKIINVPMVINESLKITFFCLFITIPPYNV